MKLSCLLLKRCACVSIRTHENHADSLPGWTWVFPVLFMTTQCPSDDGHLCRLWQDHTGAKEQKKKKGFFFFASLQTTKKQAISSMGWYHQCVGAEMCPPLVSILLGHHFFSWWKLSSGLQITNLREPFRETALPLGATELLYCIYCYPPIRLGCWRIWYFMAA